MSAPITIKGRIGKDPEIKFTNSNIAVTILSVVSNGRKQINGQWQDVDTSWWDCKAFGAYAEAIVDTIARGDLITLTGTIKQTVWVDKTGSKRSSYEVLIDSIAKQVKAEKYHGTKPRQKNSDATQWDPTEAVF